MENKKEEIMELLEGLNDSDILEMWNEYCDRNRYYDMRVEDIGFVLEELDALSFGDAMSRIDRDQFDLNDDYGRNHDLYGWQTFCDIYEVVDLGTLADYIIDNDEPFGNFEIEELLEEDEEDDDEE